MKSLIDIVCLAYSRLVIAGLSPVMPGTCGSALAGILAPWLFTPLSFAGRVAALVFVFFSGALAATRAEVLLGRKDPGSVVIDELLGMWIVLLPFENPGWKQIAVAFVLFRVFDMWKPWLVHASENWLPAGYGIMIDDVVAGIMALIVMGVLCWAGLV